MANKFFLWLGTFILAIRLVYAITGATIVASLLFNEAFFSTIQMFACAAAYLMEAYTRQYLRQHHELVQSLMREFRNG